MNWAPSETNRVGELLGRGFAEAGQSLAEGIKEHGREVQERRGYQTILKALAQDPSNGISPDAVDKMDLGTAKNSILAAEIRRQTQQRQQQARARASLPGFLSEVNGAQQPQITLDGTGPEARGAGQPGMVMGAAAGMLPTRPGTNALQAVIQALQRNPAVLDTEEGKDALSSVVKQLVAPKRVGAPTFTTVDGRTVAIEPNGTTRWAPNAPAPKVAGAAAGTGSRANPAAVLEADEELVPYVPAGAKVPVPGLYRRMKGGKSTGYWQDPQAAPRQPGMGTPGKSGTPGFADLLQAAGGASGAADNGTKAVPAQGAIIKGYRFVGGNPADKANWEPAGE